MLEDSSRIVGGEMGENLSTSSADSKPQANAIPTASSLRSVEGLDRRQKMAGESLVTNLRHSTRLDSSADSFDSEFDADDNFMQKIHERQARIDQYVWENLPEDIELFCQMSDRSRFKPPGGNSKIASKLGLNNLEFSCQGFARTATDLAFTKEFKARTAAIEDISWKFVTSTMVMSGQKYAWVAAFLLNILAAGNIVKNNLDNIHAGTLIHLTSELLPAVMHAFLYKETRAITGNQKKLKNINSLKTDKETIIDFRNALSNSPEGQGEGADGISPLDRQAAIIRIVQNQAKDIDLKGDNFNKDALIILRSALINLSSFALLNIVFDRAAGGNVVRTDISWRPLIVIGAGAAGALVTGAKDLWNGEQVPINLPTTPDRVVAQLKNAENDCCGAEQVLAATVIAKQIGRSIAFVATHLLEARMEEIRPHLVVLARHGLLKNGEPSTPEVERTVLLRLDDLDVNDPNHVGPHNGKTLVKGEKLERAHQKILRASQKPMLSFS